MPYQYILTPSMRETMEINLKNSIIIFDEAHNIGKAAEEAMSFEISTF